MAKYLAFQHRGSIEMCLAENATYSPQGWRAPRNRQFFDLRTGRLTSQQCPAEKVPASVTLAGVCTRATNVRVVDDATEQEIADIDAQMKALRQRRLAIVKDRFLSFPLVTDSDLKRSHFPETYATKKEAQSCGT
jgi:hypothetical protein